MSGREAEAASRAARDAMAKVRELGARHLAIVHFVRLARANQLEMRRALSLIEAVIAGHAIVSVSPTVDPAKSRLQIVASAAAPPEVAELLRDAMLQPLDRAEQMMCDVAGKARS